jgi:hypothetical protein
MNERYLLVLKRLYISFAVITVIAMSFVLARDFLSEVDIRNKFNKVHLQLEDDSLLKIEHSSNLSLFDNRNLIFLRAKKNYEDNNSKLSEEEKLELITLEIGLGEKPRPAIGHIQDGYQFSGGDPSKKENWTKIAKNKSLLDPNLNLIQNKCFDSEGHAITFPLNGIIPEKLSRNELEVLVAEKRTWRENCYKIKDFPPGHPERIFFEMIGILIGVSALLVGVMKWCSWVFKPVSNPS